MQDIFYPYLLLMAALYLIRHGQASFGQADYDLLSEKGQQQAFVLGQSWSRQQVPTFCYTGSLLRHEQTKQHFYHGLNQALPHCISHSGFNEFDHQDILIKYQPKWRRFNDMTAHFDQFDEPKKALADAFEQAVERWLSGEYDDQYKESWPSFKRRCVQALNDLIKQQNHLKQTTGNAAQEIAVFTSAGPITVILSHVLGLNRAQGFALNQQLRNTSVTKLLFDEQRISVDFYNNYSHLTQHDAELISFR
ncbi:histidine phosphatase family protein [Thalassotalea sp. LPB0316]|uniref:histidine phosphatase family protein n=1 Tax=Thalassotalea sp. LPB0316 TaxID=2769490 RepID=UPI0018694393|nr:histidine phosphatase family protein [Thalassotalea sp. LPB0316]QOL25824.1 histidine phosphatase family protein [Thalassotalea sp. LPB0316]